MYRFSEDIEFMQKLKTMHSNSEGDRIIDLGVRRTGRTFAMHRVAIEQAIETGEWITFIDTPTAMYSKFNTERLRETNERNFQFVIEWFRTQGVYIDFDYRIKNRITEFHFYLKSGISNHMRYEEVRLKTFSPYLKQNKVENNVNKKLLLLCQ